MEAHMSGKQINPKLIQALTGRELDSISPSPKNKELGGKYVKTIVDRRSMIEPMFPKNEIMLQCKSCGRKGKYDIGLVSFDIPEKKEDIKSTEHQMTGYFRCKHCNAAGEWEKSTELYMMSIAAMLAPDMSEGQFEFGKTQLFDGTSHQYATDAEEHLLSLIAKSPNDGFLWNRLGNLYQKGSRPELAMAAFEKSIAVDPQQAESHYSIGALLAEVKDDLNAMHHFHQVMLTAEKYDKMDDKGIRDLVAYGIANALQISIHSKGKIPFLPTRDAVPGLKSETSIMNIEIDPDDITSFYPIADTFLGKHEMREGDQGNVEKNQQLTNDIEAIDEELVDPELVEMFSKGPDYATLLQLTDELKKMKPWHYFDDIEIIAIHLEEFDETFFISVMGAAGQEYGVVIHDEEGYESLATLLYDTPTEDFHFTIEALAIYFVDRNELEKEDYQLIKDCEFSFRGKKNWIQFRSYAAGIHPTRPDYIEVEVMKQIVTSLQQIIKLRKQGWLYPQLPKYTYPAFASDGVEIDEMQPMKMENHTKPKPLHIEISEFEQKKFKRKPKVALQVEFDLFYLPFLIEDEHSGLGIYPLTIAVLDRATGEVIAHDIIPMTKTVEETQQLFWDFLNEIPIRPAKIYVSKQMKGYLLAVAKLVGMELVESELPGIQEFKEYVKSMPVPF